MTKEAWKSVREVATITAVGATEGALIGTALGVGLMSAPGYIAGGIVGGVTALSAELVGRVKKKDVTAIQQVRLSFKDTERGQRHIIKTKVREIKRDVALIQIPDVILSLHFRAWRQATGELKKWQGETHVSDHEAKKDSNNLQHCIEKQPSNS